MGINIAVGPPGFEQSLIADQVIREAKLKGLSARKMFHRLDNQQEWDQTQVVSFYIYKRYLAKI